MATAQDAITDLQAQALNAIKTGQEATAEAIQAWSNAVAKVVPTPQSVREVSPFVAAAVGDPTAIVDSVYDFASQLLTLNKQFVHQLLEAAEPAGAEQAKASAAKKSDA
jgi:hypothetical protein